MIVGHGDDLFQFNTKILHNFSSNVYYKGCSSELKKALIAKISSIENYPSPIAQELNKLAADHFKLNENQFLFTNGATEAFYLITQSTCHKKAIIVGPTFAEYEDACKNHKLAYDVVYKTAFFTMDLNDCLVFICNPNNPDGSVFSVSEITDLVKKFPTATFIIDEAYIEFCTETGSVVDFISTYNNLTVVKSVTKTFAIPGLRLGYIISNNTFINSVLRYKLPWTVNSMAIAAGNYIFNNYEQLLFDSKELLSETLHFKNALNNIPNFKVIQGFTTYFLIELEKGSASLLKNYLINEHQILVRDATNFNLIKGEFIRISVQTEQANKQLIKALKQWK